jgi:hypothetical protein
MIVDGEDNSSSSKLNLVCTSQSEICRSGETISSIEVHKCENEDEEIHMKGLSGQNYWTRVVWVSNFEISSSRL